MHAMKLIQDERQRQVLTEGFTSTHDDEYGHEILANAAYCYRDAVDANAELPPLWPWEPAWWKPKDRPRNLVRAGALFLAAAQTAERRKDYALRDRFHDHVNSCAVLLDSITA